jgi:hypothetical protein
LGGIGANVNWNAVAAIAAILAVVVAWYVGTRRSRAKVYALAPSPAPSSYCRLVINNDSDNPVHVLSARVLWPITYRLAQQRYATSNQPWVVGPELPLDWSRSISTTLTVEPGKSEVWDFHVLSTRRDRSISSIMAFHVDETRWTQISKIRVVKVVQMPPTADQAASLITIIG